MSMYTKVVVFCGSAATEDSDRIEAALTRYTNEHDRTSGFDRVAQDRGYAASAGLGEVFVGAVNHLDEDRLFTTLQQAAQNPAWYTDYAPLVVVLRHDEADHMPRTRTLDADGHWHGN